MEENQRIKKIIIISPHFPPSNLTAVHRARFFAQHLPQMGWEPVILTVHEDYYEEAPDPNLAKLVPNWLRVEKVKACKVTQPRLIGDIGLRAFRSMYRKAKKIIKEEKIDFVYITIPSFYGALWGRWLHQSTGVAYGIDYIDPWVHEFPGSNKLFSRHWWATKVSGFLEPIAVKKAALITGVAESYFEGVMQRNKNLQKNALFVSIPFGSEKRDHKKVKEFNLQPYLFKNKPEKLQMVYAGAMLPKAYSLLEKIFLAFQNNPNIFENVEIHFIGTGKTPTDPKGYTIKPFAEKYGLWKKNIFEYPQRIPYLDVLVHLNAANAVFILGSTEPHYTPSKVYQAVLSGKPILAVLHSMSSAVEVLTKSGAGYVVDFANETECELKMQHFGNEYEQFLDFYRQYNPDKINMLEFEKYSAKNITETLVQALNKIVPA
ncbi:MAG TPA: hypothetical protein PKC62_13105 [Ferruginibacter sp.]|nr:hypothetical protein [Ferruginibacter sp.]HRD43821.1 hypothetical protein [Ferruginibacter sp.]